MGTVGGASADEVAEGPAGTAGERAAVPPAVLLAVELDTDQGAGAEEGGERAAAGDDGSAAEGFSTTDVGASTTEGDDASGTDWEPWTEEWCLETASVEGRGSTAEAADDGAEE